MMNISCRRLTDFLTDLLWNAWKVIKKFLKKRLLLKNNDDGTYYVFIRFPFKISSAVKYRQGYLDRPVVTNKIVFDNYMGKGYGGNPKYIAEAILKKYPGRFDMVWLVSEKEKATSQFPAGIRTVKYQSTQAYREYATAKVWVSNYHKISYVRKGLRKRKGQYFIQTWHGSLGIKKIEGDVPLLNADPDWHRLAKISSRMVDLWISNSRFETEIYRHAFWDVGNVLEAGHPRNDLLFSEDSARVRKKVKKYFGLGDQRILFYAPTFREDYRLDCYDIGYADVLSALEQRFGGEWVILVRLHPRVQKYVPKVVPKVGYVKNATAYADIQELIAAADCMITDYSSCIFDFVLTRRPGFIFAPDVEEFDNERGFYYPLAETPFPIAYDRAGLMENIARFDCGSYREKTNAFLKDKGCVEDGHASERVADIIAGIADVKKTDEI